MSLVIATTDRILYRGNPTHVTLPITNGIMRVDFTEGMSKEVRTLTKGHVTVPDKSPIDVEEGMCWFDGKDCQVIIWR